MVRCDYCAFVTWSGRDELAPAYVEALLSEIDRARRDGLLGVPDTIFFGGGTPSLLGASLLSRLLDALGAPDANEVTIECNPESTDLALLQALRRAGATRISLGVQSLAPHVLAGLGRPHQPDTARRALAAVAEAGFTNFNVDVIYGGAGERDEDWAATLEELLALDPVPPHVSAYALTVEPGTPLALDRARHPDDDVQAERYLRADLAFSEAGLEWYEISNFARPGYECRHNLACWNQADYLGFGCAAHSHLDGRRFRNVASIDRYLSKIAAGEPVVVAEERLFGEERALEALQLALRTRSGVPRESLVDRDGLEGLITDEGPRTVLSARGRMLANEVALRLLVPPT